MGALDRVRAANGDDGFVGRARSTPWLVVAIAGGAVLLIAWIAWAIYVTSDHGARAGLGVVIVWPAMLAALAIISLPFIGGYLLIKRSSPSEDGAGAATSEVETPDADDEDEDEDEDADEEPEDPADDGEDEESDDEESKDEESEDEASDEAEDEDEESESNVEDSSRS